MNKVMLMGRLTRDPEIIYANSGTTIAKFSLAVDRRYKREGDPTADFFNCTAFGKKAEFIEKYLKQGTKIVVEGRLQSGSYTKDDGTKVKTTDVIVEDTEFAESKRAGQENSDNAQSQPKVDSDEFMSIPDGIEDELPFL